MIKYFVLSVELGRQDGWFGPKRGVYLGGRLEVRCYDDAEDNMMLLVLMLMMLKTMTLSGGQVGLE